MTSVGRASALFIPVAKEKKKELCPRNQALTN